MKDDRVYLVHIIECIRRIAAFRNTLVPDYLGIDIERIWEITQRDVADLKTVVSGMPEIDE
mgnify:CR=1 FL=1